MTALDAVDGALAGGEHVGELLPGSSRGACGRRGSGCRSGRGSRQSWADLISDMRYARTEASDGASRQVGARGQRGERRAIVAPDVCHPPRRARCRVRPAVVGLLAAGCSESAGPTPDRSTPLRLDASVTQFRFDEGTRNLKAGRHNNGTATCGSARPRSCGTASPSRRSRSPDGAVPPGQTAAFTIAYGEPQCSQPPTGRPTLVAVVDGRTRRLPLRVEDPRLLVRLHAKACAKASASTRAASVELRLGTRTETVARRGVPPGRPACCGTGPAPPARVRLVGPRRQRAVRPGAARRPEGAAGASCPQAASAGVPGAAGLGRTAATPTRAGRARRPS